MEKPYKYFLVLFFIALFLVPAIQKAFHIIPLQKFALVKYADNPELPGFTFKTFIDNTYQDSVSDWFNASAGFKPLLVRLRNQIDYSCFHVTHGKVIYGKNQYLFLDETTSAFLGLGLDSLMLFRRMDTAEMLKSYLSKLNIPLLFVVAPGKGNYFRAYMPAEYMAQKKEVTTYELLVTQLQAHQIDYINLQSYFDKAGHSSSFPLFPKQGLHWSTYGAAVGLDTIYKKVAAVLKFDPLNISLSKVTVSSNPKFPEDDLAEMINILKIPHLDTLAYPTPVCTNTSILPVKRPKILFVGDSYTYILGFTDLPKQLFDPMSKYWFYMRTEKDFTDIMKDGAPLSKINLANALKQFDMVIILSTDARYDYGDYGLYTMLMEQRGKSVNP